MKKIINVVMILLIVISVGFSVYQYNQLQGIKENLKELEQEKTTLEMTVEEKTTVIEEKDIKIKELEETVTTLEKEIGLLKEQITGLESEIEKIEAEKVKAEESKKVNTTTQVSESENNGSDPAKAAAKFGMSYGHSGREGGNNVGSGGYGIILN